MGSWVILIEGIKMLSVVLYVPLCSKHISCVHCYYEHSKCSPLALTHTVRRWRHCQTAHVWWHGLAWPTQQSVVNITYTVLVM